MRVFVLPSGEIVDIDNVLDAIIDVGWGVKSINSIVAFGSAARAATYKTEKTTEYFLGIFRYTKEHRTYIPPNDIDILVIYNESTKEFHDFRTSHITEYIGSFCDGYGVIGFKGFKKSKLHILGTTVETFEDMLSNKINKHFDAQSVRRDGIVLYGSNNLFSQRYTVRDISIEMTELIEATKTDG